MDDQRTNREGGSVLEGLFYSGGIAGALWLSIALVDMLVALKRGEWQFSIRSALIQMAVISLVLGAIVSLMKK
jgi:hypothetical protein